MTQEIQDKRGFFRLPVPFAGPDTESDEDQDWCSERSLNLVRARIKSSLTGNLDSIVRYDVTPVYSKGALKHYRVTLYMRVFDNSGKPVSFRIWKSLFVITQGVEVRIVSTNPKI